MELVKSVVNGEIEIRSIEDLEKVPRGIATNLVPTSMNAMKRVHNVEEMYLEARISNEPATTPMKIKGSP